MKTIIHILILSCAMSLGFMANAQDHRDIFEDKAKVGPLNPVLRPVTLKGTDTKPVLSNPFLLDFHYEQLIRVIKDSLSQVQIQFEKPGEIIVTTKDRPLTIRYALPDAIRFKDQQAMEDAVLILKSSNQPDGPQKRVIIEEKNQLNTAFFWETHAATFSFKTADGLLLEQESMKDDQEQKAGYKNIPLFVLADGQKQELVLGKPLRFSHKGEDYIAYAQESSYLYTEDDGGCASGGYIIRAIVSSSIILK